MRSHLVRRGTGKPLLHRRRSIRLSDYDYAQPGAYFITICTQGRLCIFGDIVGDAMNLNEDGAIVLETWQDLPCHYPHVELGAFVIMPNHVHGIVVLTAEEGPVVSGDIGEPKRAPTKRHPLPEIVRAFKAFSARRINVQRATSNPSVWQRSYYERIVRNEGALCRLRQYIADNSARWSADSENPARW